MFLQVRCLSSISIHALREEGDGHSTPDGQRVALFLSTPSARRATPTDGREGVYRKISIHALREEGDFAAALMPATTKDFYPRPPRGGRPTANASWCCPWDFYPRPPRGGRRGPSSRPHRAQYFYPRPPRGGRQLARVSVSQHNRFLSTPSARRATWRSAKEPHGRVFLSTPSARRATPMRPSIPQESLKFLSTPSARRATLTNGRGTGGVQRFLSTPSARRATSAWNAAILHRQISIHALREEGDTVWDDIVRMRTLISIHALREEGDLVAYVPSSMAGISIHALREEGDVDSCSFPAALMYFYPRPPRGGRRYSHLPT